MAFKHITRRRRGFYCNIQVCSIFFKYRKNPILTVLLSSCMFDLHSRSHSIQIKHISCHLLMSVYFEGSASPFPVVSCCQLLTGATYDHSRACCPGDWAAARQSNAGRDRSPGTQRDLRSGWSETSSAGTRGELTA